MEEQFSKLQEEMKESEHTGISGNGLVRVVMRGDRSVKSIKIQPECVDKEDVEGLEDLLLAAIQDAEQKLLESNPMNSLKLPSMW